MEWANCNAVLAEARRFAALYLRSVPFQEEALRLTLHASEAYDQTADTLDELSRLVPFIKTSQPLSPDIIEACVALLGKAKDFESAAISYLEQSISIQDQGEEICQ